MKTFIALTIVTLISISSGSISPGQVQAEIESYIGPQIYDLVSQPGIGRAGGGMACYTKYLPLITQATENSKTETQTCIDRAASRREDELNKVKQQRETLDGQVKSVADILSKCLNTTDDLEYLKCLKDNSENLQSTIKTVGQTSSALSDNLSASYTNIDTTEDSCIKTVLAKSKTDSDELIASLQNCLMNGLNDGGSDGGSNGGDGGSDGGSGGSDGGSDGDNGGSDGGDGGSDGGNGGSDGGNDGGDGGSDGGNGGSDGGNDGSDGGSDGGDGSNGGSDGGNGGSDGGSDGGNEGSDGDSDGGNGDSDGGPDGGDDGSDGGDEDSDNPEDKQLPQEAI